MGDISSTRGFKLSLVTGLLCWCQAVSASADQIVLTMTQPTDVQFPVASGIPFPRGALRSLQTLRLENAQGQETPAQFEPLATWPDGSYKAVLVIVMTQPSPTKPATYLLQYGAGVDHAAYQTPLRIDRTSSAITVSTGRIRFQLNEQRFALFDQVWADRNADGIYDPTEALLSRPADLFLLNAFDQAEYAASRFLTPTYTIEESGPVRVVIRVAGKLQAPDGQTLTDYIVRLYAYADQDLVSLDYTLVDTRDEKNVQANRKTLAVSAAGYGIRLPLYPGGTYAFGGERGQRAVGSISGTHYLYQHGEMNFVDGTLKPFIFGYDGVAAGEKAPGWMDVANARGGLSVMLRAFWQQFPKELSVDSDGLLTVSLHPVRASGPTPDLKYPSQDGLTKRYRRPNTFYFPREGGAKTYQLLMRFHEATPDPSTAERLNDLFQLPPRLVAPAAWYARTEVFGQLVEAGPWSAGYDRYLIDGIYTPSIEQLKSTGGLAIPYGWRDYGDRMRGGWAAVSPNGVKIPSFYNDTHVGAHNFFIQYVRTLDPRWWDLAEMASRHWMDIDVSHCNRWGYWAKSFGPGEGHMIKHEVIDHDDRNLHHGHAHISGLPDYYLLTGDRRALEVIHEVGNWWVNAAPVFFKTPVSNPHWAEAERDYAWPLYVMNEVYRVTGDPKYLQAGAQVVRHLIGWWQTPSDHIVDGRVIGRNDWRVGTGWWYMYPREGNSPLPPRHSNGTNPWMAGALLSSVIRFLEYDTDYRFVDHAVLNEMLLQTMNYVVKNGWQETRTYRPYDYFAYSEANRPTDGGKTHLLFPLAYLSTVHEAGGFSHPDWFDTAATWRTIAAQAYASWRVVRYRGTTATGFYGYEMIHPADFFAVMKQLEKVDPDNRPPVLEPIDNQSVDEGAGWTLVLRATDPDKDPLTFTVTNLPLGAFFNATTHVLSWTPSFAQADRYPVTVSVSDATLTDSTTFTITVRNRNRSPVAAPVDDQLISQDQPWRLTLTARDPDADPLSYTALDPLPTGASLQATAGVLTWTPTAQQVGDHRLTFAVSDGQLMTPIQFHVRVLRTNHPPTLTHVLDQTITANSPVMLTLTAADLDNDSLTLALSPLPAGASFDTATSTFNWTPNLHQVGVFRLTASVSDGTLTDSQEFAITVVRTNHPPVLDGLIDRSVKEQRMLSFTVHAVDLDGDQLSFRAMNIPPGAQFVPTRGTFVWLPTATQAGVYPGIRFEVSDGQTVTRREITITVRESVLALIGTVRRQQGGIVPGLIVRLTTPGRHSQATMTDSQGMFCFTGLTPNVPYTMVPEVPGISKKNTRTLVLHDHDQVGVELTVPDNTPPGPLPRPLDSSGAPVP